MQLGSIAADAKFNQNPQAFEEYITNLQGFFFFFFFGWVAAA